MLSLNKALYISILALVTLFSNLSFSNFNASADGSSPAVKSLDDLLNQVKKERALGHSIDEQRMQTFLAAKNQQQALVEEAQRQLQLSEQRSEELKTAFENNEAEITDAQQLLHQKTGTFGEVFGVVRQSAGELKAILEDSLISAQYPDRHSALTALAEAKTIPNVEELELLWFAFQKEMTESGKVVRFPATIITTDGNNEQSEVVRIGGFTAVAEGRFLEYLPLSQQLVVLARQPGKAHTSVARDMSNAPEDQSILPMTIDPTRGSILGLLVQAPNAAERIEQGGVIGYIIIAIGIVGLIIAAIRWVSLFVTGRRVKTQLLNLSKASDNNPLGRVLQVVTRHQNEDLEKLELRIDEAILKETPAFNRGVRLLKLLAAVAPLLGLLGTVTGMIGTFQSITLFGTGDPKLMAGGISQALVTTMLGLIVAVPLLFAHAIIHARGQRFIQILDEQSTGLIAKHFERKV